MRTAQAHELEQVLWKGGGGTWKECQQLARTYKAAPALLAALEAAYKIMIKLEGGSVREIREQARAAIAQARDARP